MQVRDLKQRSTSAHNFAMIPRADIPRSQFRMEHTRKTTFSASDLVPIQVVEVLPGDTFKTKITCVARTAVPIVPIMDNWHMEVFAFFTPCRLVWDNWKKFQGEQNNPGDSTSYTIPQVFSPAGGFSQGSIWDHFGIPCNGQIAVGQTIGVNALPARCYNRIYNEWFRDQNLQTSLTQNTNDGPDNQAAYALAVRGKRHDYFTSCLPFVQKGASAQLPLGTSAVVIPNPAINPPIPRFRSTPDTAFRTLNAGGSTTTLWSAQPQTAGPMQWENSVPTAATNTALIADLSTATAATINQLRTSFQIQKVLERDARGGTRYTEIVRAHFGVVSPDARQQRPEYIGGGRFPVNIQAIPQTSATGLTGGSTPAGTLAATGNAQGTCGYTYAATEHGYILVLANVRADLTYQQGLHKLWSRQTRYDIYLPAFAHLGEQPVANREIFCDGSANDALTFGYQERWAEYRYMPNQICGLFRSTSGGTIDYWHSAQLFGALPTLNSTFIQDGTKTVIQRNFAAGSAANGQQFLCDFFFDMVAGRPLPRYSVPGLVDHF